MCLQCPRKFGLVSKGASEGLDSGKWHRNKRWGNRDWGGGSGQDLCDWSRLKALCLRASCYQQLFEDLIAGPMPCLVFEENVADHSLFVQSKGSDPTSDLLLIWQSSSDWPGLYLILDSIPKVNFDSAFNTVSLYFFFHHWIRLGGPKAVCVIHAACNSPGLAWLPHLGPGVDSAVSASGTHTLTRSCAWAALPSALPTSDPMGEGSQLLSWNWRGQEFLRSL